MLQVEVRGIPHLAKNERDMGHPLVDGRDSSWTDRFSCRHFRFPEFPRLGSGQSGGIRFGRDPSSRMSDGKILGGLTRATKHLRCADDFDRDDAARPGASQDRDTSSGARRQARRGPFTWSSGK